MKPPQFEYVRAESAADAVSALADCGEYARILAGGQSLIPLMNMRLSHPSHLIDVTHVRELDFVTEEDSSIVIGAAARQATVESFDFVRKACPLLVDALELVAHPPIRHRGTVCGSLAHADPASELAAVALTLDATFSIQGSTGTRSVPAGEFFLGPFTTATSADEMLRDVRMPAVAPGTGTSIVEFTRTHGNFAIAGAVALVELAGDGTIARAALTIFGVSGEPRRAVSAEQLLLGAEPTEQVIHEAAELALQDIECSSDMHGSAVYRARIGRVYARRALATAVSRAHGGER